MTVGEAMPVEGGRDESGQRRSGELRRNRSDSVGEDGRNGSGELRRRVDTIGDDGRNSNGHRNRIGLRADQGIGGKEVDDSRRKKVPANPTGEGDRSSIGSRCGKRTDQLSLLKDSRPVKYYPHHPPSKVHKPYEREASTVAEQGKDVVVALSAKENEAHKVVESKNRSSKNGLLKSDHATREGLVLGKRKSTTAGSPLEDKATKKVTVQEPLISSTVESKQSPSPVARPDQTYVETKDKKVIPDKVKDGAFQITLCDEAHIITEEVLASLEKYGSTEVPSNRHRRLVMKNEATTIDEDLGNLDPYGDLVDYELDVLPNISQDAGIDDVQTGIDVVTQSTFAQTTVVGDNANGTEKGVSIVEGYPFRYNISEKAQKLINDVVYVDVAEAVRKLQMTLNQVVKERDDFERQWKDATRIAESETNHLQQVGDLEKELAKLKSMQYEDQDMFEFEIEQHKRRANLAVEEMKKEQDAKFEIRAELQHREALVASVREQMKVVAGRNEELRKFLESQNMKIPAELSTPLPKNYYG